VSAACVPSRGGPGDRAAATVRQPDNLVVHILTREEAEAAAATGGGGGREQLTKPVLKLADFGSAVDPHAVARLYAARLPSTARRSHPAARRWPTRAAGGRYGQTGPSTDEETLAYAPPEAPAPRARAPRARPRAPAPAPAHAPTRTAARRWCLATAWRARPRGLRATTCGLSGCGAAPGPCLRSELRTLSF
jgi:hypothetical protein